MNITLALKLLDLAMIGIAAFDRYQARHGETAGELEQVRQLREDVLLGRADADQLADQVDALIERLQQSRQSSFRQLPRPGSGHGLTE